jgi:hypothetical protein
MPPKKGVKKVKPPPEKFTPDSLNKGIRHKYTKLHSQYTGYHSAVIQQVAKKKVEDRKSQFLTHLATTIKAWYSEVSNTSEIEIQIAIYDDERVIISSNKNETAEFMYGEFVKVQAANFLKYLKGVAMIAGKAAEKSTKDDSARRLRHAGKLTKEVVEKRDVGLPMLQQLEREGKDLCVHFDSADAIGDSFAAFLKGTGEMANKRVAVVTSSGGGAHAEQKILVALCKAALNIDRTKTIVVAGTFRPCRGCFESLSVVQKYAFENLQFGVRPGHFWQTTTKEHLEIIRLLKEAGLISPKQLDEDFDENTRLKGLTDTSHRPMLRLREEMEVEALHYATDSDSEDEGGMDWDD